MIIKLNQEKETIIDEEDFEFISQWKWFYVKRGYVVRNNHIKGHNTQLKLHRILINAPDGIHVDHINGNKLDNRKINLRLCTNQENTRNQKKRKNALYSQFKGVTFDPRRNKYYSRIKTNEHQMFLGYFINEIDAAKAYNEAAIKYFGEFAKLNNIDKSK